MTKDQKDQVSYLMSRYIAMQSQSVEYEWQSDLNNPKAYNLLIDELRKLNIDFNELSLHDAKILGLTEFDTHTIGKIWLIPIFLYRAIKKGTILYDISGDKVEVGKYTINTDTRAGYLAYGVKIK